MKPKAKKGQVLVAVLVAMAFGLIVIAPLLRYVDTTYNVYLYANTRSSAYYAADAMMEQIINNMTVGQNVSNYSTYYNQSAANGWLNGYNVNTSITPSIIYPPSTPTAADRDFTITTTAWKKSINDSVASITAAIRQSSGNSITIFYWQAKYY